MVKFKDNAHSKQEMLEAKKRRNAKIVAIVISLLFLFSALIVFVQRDDISATNSFKVKDYVFTPKSMYGSTVLEISTANSYDKAIFFSLPEENYSLYFKPDEKTVVDSILSKSFIYLSIDPRLVENNSDVLQYQELGRMDLSSFFEKGKKVVFNSMAVPYADAIVFGCENATDSSGVISFVFNPDLQDGIYQNEDNPNCIEIISKPQMTTILVDDLKFALLQR